MGSPINVWFNNSYDEELGSIVPKTPPPQQLLEELRNSPIRDEGKHKAGYVVHAGNTLPEYEESPPYE